MQNTTIGTAQIKLVVDASQVQQGLNEAKTTVENTATTTGKSFDDVQQRIDGNGAAAQRFGQDVENAGERGKSALSGLKQAVAGIGAAFASFQQGLRIGNNLFGDSEQMMQFFRTLANGKPTLEDLKKQLNDVTQEIARLEEGGRFDIGLNNINAVLAGQGTIFSDLKRQQQELQSQVSRSAKQQTAEEYIERVSAFKATIEESKRATKKMALDRLEGIERVNAEERELLDSLKLRRDAAEKSSVDEALKNQARLAYAEEEAAIRAKADGERAKIQAQERADAEREAADAAREKARQEQESARAMEQQTRESERRAQVESQARAQAQRDQMLSNALEKQAVALDKVLQAIQLQTEITKSLRRVL